jgi:hypothetical protein
LVELAAATRADTEAAATLREQAAACARALMSLQVRRREDSHSSVWGFFLDGPANGRSIRSMEPYREPWRGYWPLLALCRLAEELPDHADAHRWLAAIERCCAGFLVPMSERNAFGIVPYGLYRSPPPGARRIGGFWYRWFIDVDPHWYVGNNAIVASAGVCLARAAALLDRPVWRAAAQRRRPASARLGVRLQPV